MGFQVRASLEVFLLWPLAARHFARNLQRQARQPNMQTLHNAHTGAHASCHFTSKIRKRRFCLKINLIV
jgi:hypothetical protein